MGLLVYSAASAKRLSGNPYLRIAQSTNRLGHALPVTRPERVFNRPGGPARRGPVVRAQRMSPGPLARPPRSGVAHGREEHDLADRAAPGQEHHEPVDPEPDAGRGRHPLLEGGQERLIQRRRLV
jgi:hypothetical protein